MPPVRFHPHTEYGLEQPTLPGLRPPAGTEAEPLPAPVLPALYPAAPRPLPAQGRPPWFGQAERNRLAPYCAHQLPVPDKRTHTHCSCRILLHSNQTSFSPFPYINFCTISLPYFSEILKRNLHKKEKCFAHGKRLSRPAETKPEPRPCGHVFSPQTYPYGSNVGFAIDIAPLF